MRRGKIKKESLTAMAKSQKKRMNFISNDGIVPLARKKNKI